MERLPYGVYSKGFREEAVKLVRERNISKQGGKSVIVSIVYINRLGQGV